MTKDLRALNEKLLPMREKSMFFALYYKKMLNYDER
jgi:hypothetical protein